MESSSINWDHLCTYQLLPCALKGHHQILQLDSIQLSYAAREGGMMHNALAPYDCVSIAVIEECADKACFGYMKLHVDDILFFDDSSPINLICNGKVKFTIISIPKNSMNPLIEKLEPLLGAYINDTNKILTKKLTQILEIFRKIESYQNAENELFEIVLNLIKNQTPMISKLTKGEKIALDIRNQVYNHMDGKVDIKAFALQYNTTEQTLQNSFKSIFGFTPKIFLRLLKLNLVHHDLKNTDHRDTTVSKIASRWGFSHMGRFSAYYTELFGSNPSIDLKTYYPKDKSMTEPCTARQEEL